MGREKIYGRWGEKGDVAGVGAAGSEVKERVDWELWEGKRGREAPTEREKQCMTRVK